MAGPALTTCNSGENKIRLDSKATRFDGVLRPCFRWIVGSALVRLSEAQCHADADRSCWLVPGGGQTGGNRVGEKTTALLRLALDNDNPHLPAFATIQHLVPGVHFGISS